MMLTKKQKQLLDFISHRIERDSVPPSFEEMKDHLGLKSKSGVHRLVTALAERGHIVRLPHMARAIALTGARGENPAGEVLALKIAEIVKDEKNIRISKAEALRRIGRTLEMFRRGVLHV